MRVFSKIYDISWITTLFS